MSEKDQILFQAYKSMVMANVRTGFFQQHMSDLDFYAFDKFPEFFLEVVEQMSVHHRSEDVVKKFFEINTHRQTDTELAKEIFKRITYAKDFKILIEIFTEELFLNDLEVLKCAVKNVGGPIFDPYYGFTKLNLHEKLREELYNFDSFSLNWFKLPAPDNDKLIREILQKNYPSFTSLNDSQKENKEYVLLTLEKMVDSKSNWLWETIYKEIPLKLKSDRDVALLASRAGFFEQPAEAFTNEGILKVLLDFVSNSAIDRRRGINLDLLETLPGDIYKKPENIQVLLEWLNSNKDRIEENHKNYGIYYKIMKEIAKRNTYVNEQFRKADSDWHIGNLGKTKHDSSTTFKIFFSKHIPKICQELKYYVLAEQLSRQPNINESKTQRPKI